MKKIEPKEIGYYGKPITALTRNELLEAIAEFAMVIYECSAKDKKLADFFYIKKEQSNLLKNTKRTK